MNTTPYVSVEELIAAPTGISWATIPEKGASDEEKRAEQMRLTRRATAWVNMKCNQSLNASLDTEVMRINSRRCMMQPDGTLYVIAKYSPIVQVQSVEVSPTGELWQPSDGVAMLATRASFSYRFGRSSGGSRSPQFPGVGGYLRFLYLDGYVNTELGVAVASGDLTLTVLDPTGLLPGLVLTLYNREFEEEVIVADDYVTGDTLVTLVNGTLYDHAVAVRVSALPVAVREAAILAATHYVRVRGRNTITVQPTGGTRNIVSQDQTEELDEAGHLLTEYARIL